MIDWRRYADTDTGILYSLLNMKLRNEGADLDELTRRYDIDRTALEAHMAQYGYRYEPATRQFRAAGRVDPRVAPIRDRPRAGHRQHDPQVCRSGHRGRSR